MFQSAKQHVALIGCSTLLGVFSLVIIVRFTDPYTSGALTLVFFYLSLFLVSVGLFTVLGLFIRQIILRTLYITNLANSFRQSVLISLLITVSLLLQSQALLFWWVEISLILLLAATEFFLSLKL